jgi:hypothetical protein
MIIIKINFSVLIVLKTARKDTKDTPGAFDTYSRMFLCRANAELQGRGRDEGTPVL